MNRKNNIEQRMMTEEKDNDILEEAEELINIVVASIKTAENKKK